MKDIIQRHIVNNLSNAKLDKFKNSHQNISQLLTLRTKNSCKYENLAKSSICKYVYLLIKNGYFN